MKLSGSEERALARWLRGYDRQAEATSALDNLTQKIVTDSLDTLDCTRIVTPTAS